MFFPRVFILILLLTGFATAVNAASLRSMQFDGATRDDAGAWQKKLRSHLARLMQIEDLRNMDLPFDIEDISTIDIGEDCTAEEIKIRVTPNRFMKAILAKPADLHGRAPAIVAIHGHGGNRFTPFDPEKKQYKCFGNALVRNGYIVISTDVGQHEVYEKGRLLMGERLLDLMRCVDCLVSLPEVDPDRIGCAGLSLGGEMAMWLGAMDTRIVATSSCGFLTRMDQMEQNHCMCWKFDGLRELADFADIYGLIAPRALQCQNGEQEPPTQFTPAIAREALQDIQPVYAAYGVPERLALHVHGGGHEIDLQPMISFLDHNLKPAPNTDQP